MVKEAAGTVNGKRRKSFKRELRHGRSDIGKSEKQPEVGFGTRVAALFAECGLDEPIEELRGYTIEPMKFDS